MVMLVKYCSADCFQTERTVGGFPVGICRVEYQLLCRTLDDDPLAHFPQGSRRLISSRACFSLSACSHTSCLTLQFAEP